MNKLLESKALLAHIASHVFQGPAATIYKNPCPHCPSTKGFDPETEDVKRTPRSVQLSSVFRCGWRREKACKGYCDAIGVTESELRAYVENQHE